MNKNLYLYLKLTVGEKRFSIFDLEPESPEETMNSTQQSGLFPKMLGFVAERDVTR